MKKKKYKMKKKKLKLWFVFMHISLLSDHFFLAEPRIAHKNPNLILERGIYCAWCILIVVYSLFSYVSVNSYYVRLKEKH